MGFRELATFKKFKRDNKNQINVIFTEFKLGFSLGKDRKMLLLFKSKVEAQKHVWQTFGWNILMKGLCKLF